MLTSITIPDSIISIGDYAFFKCYSLYSVYYGGTASQWASISFSNTTSTPMSYATQLYINETLATDVTLNNITTINNYAFYGCSLIESVTIESDITSISNYAFCDCSSLTSITIPNSVTSIGKYAFLGCYSLKSIYYNGTALEWLNISIDSYNTNLTSATIYYTSR